MGSGRPATRNEADPDHLRPNLAPLCYGSLDTSRLYALRLRAAGVQNNTLDELVADVSEFPFLHELKQEIKAKLSRRY